MPSRLGALFAPPGIDFGPGPYERQLTLIFRLLLRVGVVLGLVLAAWSVAAGCLEAGRAAAPWTNGWADGRIAAVALAASLAYALEALGAMALLALAAALCGAFLGFLFALPHRVADAPQPAPQPDADPPPGAAFLRSVAARPGAPGAAARPAAGLVPGLGFSSSTNLTRVSDWLTNIIVGVTLVLARPIVERFIGLSHELSTLLFAGADGSVLVVPSVLVAGGVLGFLFAYLFTQLFLAELMAFADVRIRTQAGRDALQPAVEAMRKAAEEGAPMFEPIDPGQSTRARDAPSVPKPVTQAAHRLSGLDLAAASEDPALLRAWSRAKSLLGDSQAAAAGMRRLVASVPSDPGVALDAARALFTAGDHKEAVRTLGTVMPHLDELPAAQRSRALFDACNLALYDGADGYKRVLDLLTPEAMEADRGGGLQVLRACALGAAQARAPADDPGRAERAAEALELLRTAIDRSERNRSWIKYLMDPKAAGKAAQKPAERDDDLVPFAAEPGFRGLVAPPARQPPG